MSFGRAPRFQRSGSAGPGPAAYTTIKSFSGPWYSFGPAYLYNSRPLKLDPPWSDSHRRRSWTGPSTRSSVSAASRSGWGRQLGGAWKSCAGTTPRVRGRKGWPASCGNWWRTWRRRPGSAAGARDTPRHTASKDEAKVAAKDPQARDGEVTENFTAFRAITASTAIAAWAFTASTAIAARVITAVCREGIGTGSPQQSYHWRGTRTRWTSSGCECDVSGTTHGSQTLEASREDAADTRTRGQNVPPQRGGFSQRPATP